ncbi:MAG: hypothetical protein ACOYNH_04825 [Bacteroidia bacterium]
MVLDRNDGTINIFKFKFSINQFAIDKKYNAELLHKAGVFKLENKIKKAVSICMLSSFGIAKNQYFW